VYKTRKAVSGISFTGKAFRMTFFAYNIILIFLKIAWKTLTIGRRIISERIYFTKSTKFFLSTRLTNFITRVANLFIWRLVKTFFTVTLRRIYSKRIFKTKSA
jgi:hypothetical protein